mmetsp:Transcript_17135/g.26197  ORF Transcript_17135/g.26197 Transcript_17135/m.26197 type:complete len:125 (-) Transcript_17135:495-869(-)
MDFNLQENMDVENSETNSIIKIHETPLIQRHCQVSMTNKVHDQEPSCDHDPPHADDLVVNNSTKQDYARQNSHAQTHTYASLHDHMKAYDHASSTICQCLAPIQNLKNLCHASTPFIETKAMAS